MIELRTQTFEPIRQNLECGFDPNNIQSGREPCQHGWYNHVSLTYCQDMTVLDVGCGMCEGMKIMENNGCKEVHGQEIDSRLSDLHQNIIIDKIENIEDNAYDCVTCFDVIEHVIDDYLFFENLKRIARKYVFITTPNWTRSHAQNHCHCREYTIPQFLNYFEPDELWSASPDGRVHLTQLMVKNENGDYVDKTRDNKIWSEINDDLTWTHSTVDGEEWPHHFGIWRLDNA
jgi:2-polyprenyl-3-methyl-5-hydroxy-6-metoxy-1,4-benzoquinol methylase